MTLTEGIIYDNNCSCALNANCRTQSILVDRSSLDIISIPGVRIGCTSIESFLASTLECFYNSSCIMACPNVKLWCFYHSIFQFPRKLYKLESLFKLHSTH